MNNLQQPPPTLINQPEQQLNYQCKQQQQHYQKPSNDAPQPQQKQQLLPQHQNQRQQLVDYPRHNIYHPTQNRNVDILAQPNNLQQPHLTQKDRGSTEWNRANYNIPDQQPRQQHINCSSDTQQLQQQIHQPQLGQRQYSRRQQQQQQPQSNNGTPHLERQQQPQPNNEMPNPELQHNRRSNTNKLRKNTRDDLTVILGDSMTRGINARNIRRSTSKNVIIRTFSGATINDMLDYIKPSLRLQPDHIIIHAGTNDLRSTEANAIIENISKLCDEIYNFCPKIDITTSQLITRTDSPDINGKVAHTNNLLHDLCEARNLGIIIHENIDERGLDRFGLHLNRTGSDILARNLINCIQHF